VRERANWLMAGWLAGDALLRVACDGSVGGDGAREVALAAAQLSGLLVWMG
jgi:hypothetical protein